MNAASIESVLWDDWHVVAELERLQRAGRFETALLGVPISVALNAVTGQITVRQACADILHAEVKYGFVWICLGRPARQIVDFPEVSEPDRLTVAAGSVAVKVSGLRAIENFLDLSHLPIVHAGFLGEGLHTEIENYSVGPLPEGGILATDCRVYQPKSSPGDLHGSDVDYVYAVLRPYIAVLYKSNPVDPTRKDMIALMVQPVSEESCITHMLTSYVPHQVDARSIRSFSQLIFGQDRPILENQVPKRLPLDPLAETSVRCDRSSAAYRRWLMASGVRFGAIWEQ